MNNLVENAYQANLFVTQICIDEDFHVCGVVASRGSITRNFGRTPGNFENTGGDNYQWVGGYPVFAISTSYPFSVQNHTSLPSSKGNLQRARAAAAQVDLPPCGSSRFDDQINM